MKSAHARSSPLADTAKTRELGAQECDSRGDVGQHAPRQPDRRLGGLAAGSGQGALSVVQEWLDRFHLAADDGVEPLGKAQARSGAKHLYRQRGKPAAQSHALASAKQRIDVPLDQLGRPGRVPGRQRMPDRIIGQIMDGAQVIDLALEAIARAAAKPGAQRPCRGRRPPPGTTPSTRKPWKITAAGSATPRMPGSS